MMIDFNVCIVGKYENHIYIVTNVNCNACCSLNDEILFGQIFVLLPITTIY